MNKISQSKMNEFLWLNKEIIFENLSSLGTEVPEIGTNSYRMNPCPFCGHNDCCCIAENESGIALGKCFSNSCGRGFNFQQLLFEAYDSHKIPPLPHLSTLLNVEFLDDSIVLTQEEKKMVEIRALAVEFYHKQLLDDSKALDYLKEERKHNADTVALFKIGLAKNWYKLKETLLQKGFTGEEIKEAKVWFHEGLLIYPYFRGNKVVRFNTKNKFGVIGKEGKEIKGQSTGKKTFYAVPGTYSQGSVVLCEGEDDAQTLFEEGLTNVIATGGVISADQLEELSSFKEIYLFGDHDHPGEKMITEVNEALPHVKCYQIEYDSSAKDPDEYYKRSSNPVALSNLLKNAIPLENENFKNQVVGSTLKLINRNYTFSFEVKQANKGKYKGDFRFHVNGELKEVKYDASIDKVGKAYLKYVDPAYNALFEHFNEGLKDKNLDELMSIYKFSSRKEKIITEMTKRVNGASMQDDLLDHIQFSLGSKMKEEILKELNALKNSNIDINKSFKKMTVAQAFDLENNVGYIYFNSKRVEGENNENLRIIPALLTSDKRVIRLDHIVRKDPQYLLIIDQAFELPFEVGSSIMDDEVASLSHKYAMQYIDNGVKPEVLQPGVLIRALESNFKELYYCDDSDIYKLLALYCYSTYLYQLFGENAYLYLNGEKGNGKSLVCKILSLFCFCTKFVVATSEAALFRSISIEGGTFILDEMENIGSREVANESTMATILKAGYNRDGGKTMRYNMEKECTDRFSLYSPKIISNIAGIEDVIEDRCIKIPIKRYSPSLTQSKKSVKVFEEENKEEIKRLTSMCCLSALVNFREIYEVAKNTKFEGVTSRASQILKPLYVLAQFAGEDYKKALDNYYKNYIVLDKQWTETNTPEGLLKEILKIVAEEIKEKKYELLRSDYILPSYYKRKDDDKFMITTLAIKLLMDIYDGKKNYNMAEVHKIIKRVYPQLDLSKKTRTTFSIKNYEELTKRMGKPTISTYWLEFNYYEFIENDFLKIKMESVKNEDSSSLEDTYF